MVAVAVAVPVITVISATNHIKLDGSPYLLHWSHTKAMLFHQFTLLLYPVYLSPFYSLLY